MKKIEVISNGVVIGYTYDEVINIEFLDNDEALKVKKKLFNGEPIGISSRKMGTVDGDGKVIFGELNELGIVNISKEQKKQNKERAEKLKNKEWMYDFISVHFDK